MEHHEKIALGAERTLLLFHDFSWSGSANIGAPPAKPLRRLLPRDFTWVF